jgi:OOP family OmpA-OmpF porin
MEIGGHTDAQGSTTGNLALSQARAEAVLVALQGRQVDVSAMRAVGYGEGVPIADNGTDDGREANRRIEFTLIDQPIGNVPGQGGSQGAGQGPDAGAEASKGLASLFPKGGAPTGPVVQFPGTAAPATDAATDAATGAVVSETAADGTPLAPEKPTIRPKPRPSK